MTALMYAVNRSDTNTIEALVKAGANLDIKDTAGKSARDYAQGKAELISLMDNELSAPQRESRLPSTAMIGYGVLAVIASITMAALLYQANAAPVVDSTIKIIEPSHAIENVSKALVVAANATKLGFGPS